MKMEKDDFRKPHKGWLVALWSSWNIKNPVENTGVTLYVFHKIVEYVDWKEPPEIKSKSWRCTAPTPRVTPRA